LAPTFGEAVGALDAVERARFFDAGHGHAQVAVVLERGGDERLHARVGEVFLPRHVGDVALAARVDRSGPLLGHRRFGPEIVGHHRTAGTGQQQRQRQGSAA